MNAKSIRAVILAGGIGSRLQTVVNDRPKVMAPIGGRPFITYLFDQLLAAKFRAVTLSTGYMSDYIEKKLGHGYLGHGHKDLQIDYSRETNALGTGGALRLALEQCERGASSDDDFDSILVMNGDSYLDIDIVEYLIWFRAKKYANALVLNCVENTARFGTVTVSDQEEIISFREKTGMEVAGVINAGIYLLSRCALLSLPLNKNFSLEKDVFPTLTNQKKLHGFISSSRFIDIGIPEDYAKARTFFNPKSAQS
ncbi:MAG: nucleotidyltransferase family protein [Oligoflexia bacterium]|nr:nucleotidyltransferase family protein [Oligoflexia bacterium]